MTVLGSGLNPDGVNSPPGPDLKPEVQTPPGPPHRRCGASRKADWLADGEMTHVPTPGPVEPVLQGCGKTPGQP